MTIYCREGKREKKIVTVIVHIQLTSQHTHTQKVWEIDCHQYIAYRIDCFEFKFIIWIVHYYHMYSKKRESKRKWNWNWI